MRLGGPQSRSGRGGEEKNSQPLSGLEPPIMQPVAQRYTDWAIPASYCKCALGTLCENTVHELFNFNLYLEDLLVSSSRNLFTILNAYRLLWGEYLYLRGRKWREAGENCTVRSFMACTLHQILLGWSSQGGWDGRGMYHSRERWEMNTIFSSGNVKVRDHWEDLVPDRRNVLKLILGSRVRRGGLITSDLG
jgi:hypothetical protein